MKTFKEVVKDLLEDDENYGVKGDIESDITPDALEKDVDVTKEDRVIIGKVVNKLNSGIQLFSELLNVLNSYKKLNSKPIEDIINKIRSYQNEIEKELE